ncbi:hypothetical protein Ndes2526B_g05555 [Nannochloris sp. 'desiccata']|nr:hypothetical protein KSW81_007413 [Chlorella desiccata (nom. nud.)]KAH7618639.1 hypothetical protein NADE_005488 [Chlorella desiccata (nom. nud.)]
MPFNIVTSLSSLAILVLLVIEHPDLVNAKKNDNNGLVQLAQKEFSAFLQHAADSAGKSVIKSLNSKYINKFTYALQEADLDSLQVWQGQALDLSLDVNNVPHRVYSGGPQKEDQWISLRRILPDSQGGIRLHADWDAIESNLVRPLRDGAVLPDFMLEGPLDLYITPPADLQLWLPHSVEAGVQKRVMLRTGAAVTVRGARSVQLRRPIDLPEISLSDFVDFAIEDKEKHQAAGLMHLATGLREKATEHWNKTGEDKVMTPAVIGLDLDFSCGGVGGVESNGKKKRGEGTLFAAPDEHGALQKLRVKRMGEGVLEISVRPSRESLEGGSRNADRGGGGGSRLSADSSKALVLGRPGSPYVWPFRSASPETVITYEHLLRELLSRHVFSSSTTSRTSKAKRENKKGGATSIAAEVPLKLHRSSSTAVFLMKMELAVLRNPVVSSAGRISEKDSKEKKKEKDDAPPTPGQLLQKIAATGDVVDLVDDGSPRREVYSTVLQIEGSAREGLSFSPVGPIQLIERTSDMTATFDMPAALSQVAGELGLGVLSNASRIYAKDEL